MSEYDNNVSPSRLHQVIATLERRTHASVRTTPNDGGSRYRRRRRISRGGWPIADTAASSSRPAISSVCRNGGDAAGTGIAANFQRQEAEHPHDHGRRHRLV